MITGSLQKKTSKNKKEYYYMVLNFYNESGKRCPKWISTGLETKGNKRKADEMLRTELSKHQDGNYYNHDSDMLFSDWIEYWLNSIKSNVTTSTYEGYCLHSKHVIDYFKITKLRLRDLKVKHFEQFYQEMLTEGKINQKTKEKSGLSVRTVRSHKFIINAALNKAVANEILNSNPALNVKVTNRTKKQLARKVHFLQWQSQMPF